MVNVQFVKKNVQKLKNQSVLLMDKPMKANVKCIKEIVIQTLHGFPKFLMENVNLNVKEVSRILIFLFYDFIFIYVGSTSDVFGAPKPQNPRGTTPKV